MLPDHVYHGGQEKSDPYQDARGMLEDGKNFLTGRRAVARAGRGSMAVRMRAGTVRQADGDVDEADDDIAEIAAASVGIL